MKDIPGYEGRYAITEEGKVWSYPNRRNRFIGMWLKPYMIKNGSRPCVSLFTRDGSRHTCQVHRLVASAFLLNPENKPMINHIDGNPLNPSVANLEWVTNKENSDHAFRTGLMAKPLTEGEVRELRKVCQFHSCRSVARAYGMSPATVWDIAAPRGRRYKEAS